MISVIIPTYNEPLTVLKTIEAVVAQLGSIYQIAEDLKQYKGVNLYSHQYTGV